MTAATVAQVGARVTGAPEPDAVDGFGLVLPLRTTGTEPPLFCLPPASGLSWPYAGLKRHLPQNVPLYGLQSPLFSGGTLPEHIAELAASYVEAVTSIAPDGPIRLLGWSFGGAVALLIAQQLAGRGREVGFVGMLDSYPDTTEDHDFDAGAVLAGVLREMGFPVDPGARMTTDEAVALMRSHDDAIAILDDARIAMAVENYVAAERFNVGADYGRYDGDVFFVDATLEPIRSGLASAAWRDHVGGELRVTALNCRHSDLLDAEVLETLGPLIARALAP